MLGLLERDGVESQVNDGFVVGTDKYSTTKSEAKVSEQLTSVKAVTSRHHRRKELGLRRRERNRALSLPQQVRRWSRTQRTSHPNQSQRRHGEGEWRWGCKRGNVSWKSEDRVRSLINTDSTHTAPIRYFSNTVLTIANILTTLILGYWQYLWIYPKRCVF